MLPNGSRFVEHVEAPFATVEELGVSEPFIFLLRWPVRCN